MAEVTGKCNGITT